MNPVRPTFFYRLIVVILSVQISVPYSFAGGTKKVIIPGDDGRKMACDVDDTGFVGICDDLISSQMAQKSTSSSMSGPQQQTSTQPTSLNPSPPTSAMPGNGSPEQPTLHPGNAGAQLGGGSETSTAGAAGPSGSGFGGAGADVSTASSGSGGSATGTSAPPRTDNPFSAADAYLNPKSSSKEDGIIFRGPVSSSGGPIEGLGLSLARSLANPDSGIQQLKAHQAEAERVARQDRAQRDAQLERTVAQYQAVAQAGTAPTAELREIRQGAYQTMRSLSAVLRTVAASRAIPKAPEPIPVPTDGLPKEMLAEILAPLERPDLSPLQTAEAVSQIEERITGLKATEGTEPDSSATYLDQNLKTKWINDQGLLKNLAHTELEQRPLLSARHSQEGHELRKSINETLAATSTLLTQCLGSMGDTPTCHQAKQWAQELLAGYTYLDDLAAYSSPALFRSIKSDLDLSKDALVRSTQSSSTNTGDLTTKITHLSEKIPAISRAMGEIFSETPKLSEEIQKYAGENFERFLNSTPEERQEISYQLAGKLLTGPFATQPTLTLDAARVNGLRDALLSQSITLAHQSAEREGRGKEARAQLQDTLRLIPDPGEANLGYEFQSAPGPVRDELVRNYQDLYKFQPQGNAQKISRELGLNTTRQADQALARGETDDAHFYQEIGKGLLDLTVGLDPITGFGRNAYELATGKNLITGEKLSQVDRAFAFVGIATLGWSNVATKAARMNRVFQGAARILREKQAIQKAVHVGQGMAQKVEHLLPGMTKNARIIAIHTAELVNRTHFPHWPDTPPFQALSHAIEFITLKDSQWVRVHSGANEVGEWVVRKSAIHGLTPQQIKDKFNLPHLPTHVSDVHVPKGTSMLRGNVHDHGSGQSGAIQYWIDRDKNGITKKELQTWFKNARPL